MTGTKPLKDLIDITHPLVGYYKLKNGMDAVVTHVSMKKGTPFFHGFFTTKGNGIVNSSWRTNGRIAISSDRQFDLDLPLKTEVGKYYRTRCGDIACVCFKQGSIFIGMVNYPDTDAEGIAWYGNGRIYNDGWSVDDLDLIAECTPDGKDMP